MIENTQANNQVISGFNIKSNIAPLSKRLFAHVIDSGVTGIFIYIGVLLAVFIFGITIVFVETVIKSMFGNDTAILGILTMILMVVLVLAFILAYHGYFVYFEYKKGQTPGKKIMGLKVVSDDGKRLTLKQCMIREAFKWIDLLYIPSLVCMLMTDKNQRVGDLAAHTFVTHSVSQEDKHFYIYLAQTEYDLFFQHLVPQELSHIEREEFLSYAGMRFLYDSDEFEFDDEYWAKYFKQKVHIDDNVKLSDEDFLRFVAQYCYLKEREDGTND